MAGNEVSIKVNVDSSQIDEVIEKVKQLTEAILVADDLMDELTNANTANVTAEIAMDSKFVAHELYHSQLAKKFEKTGASIKERLNRSRY